MHVAAAALCNRALTERCLDLTRSPVTDVFNIDDLAGSFQPDGIGQLTAVVDLLVVDPDDDVIDVQTGFLGCRSWFDGGYQRTTILCYKSASAH